MTKVEKVYEFAKVVCRIRASDREISVCLVFYSRQTEDKFSTLSEWLRGR
jgi:hypothetical protein